MYNLPNILTLSRIAVIPVIFLSVYVTSYTWAMFAGALFIAASVTDYFDGYLARAWNETSSFGRLLDPIADKLLVATALVVILVKPNMYSLSLTVLPVFVILCREILVSGLREFLREVNVGLPVTKLAKWKTGFQMTALSMMMFRELWIGWGYLGEFLLWVAATLTFITGYQYYQKSLDYVKAEEKMKKDVKKTSDLEAVKTADVKTTDSKAPVAQKRASAPKANKTKIVKSKAVPSKTVKKASTTLKTRTGAKKTVIKKK